MVRGLLEQKSPSNQVEKILKIKKIIVNNLFEKRKTSRQKKKNERKKKKNQRSSIKSMGTCSKVSLRTSCELAIKQ